MQHHPSHTSSLPDLERIGKGLQDIAAMIEGGHYCIEIIRALRGVAAEIQGVQDKVLQTHVEHCLEQVAMSGDEAEKRRMTTEVLEVLGAASS